MKICINFRDELHILDLDKVACFQAEGNYTNVLYISGQKQTLSIGISKMEQVIKQAYPKGVRSPFVRLGRSVIINQAYLMSINLPKQRLTLADYARHGYTLTVPKQLLKNYKEVIKTLYQKDEKNSNRT